MTAKKSADQHASDVPSNDQETPNGDPTVPPETLTAPPAPDPIDEASEAQVTHRYSGARVITGVPPRDLTALDWERLTPQEIREAIQPGPDGKPLYAAI